MRSRFPYPPYEPGEPLPNDFFEKTYAFYDPISDQIFFSPNKRFNKWTRDIYLGEL